MHIPIPSLLLRLAKHGSAFKGGLILLQRNNAMCDFDFTQVQRSQSHVSFTLSLYIPCILPECGANLEMCCSDISASERFRTAWRSDWSNLITPLFMFDNIDQSPLD